MSDFEKRFERIREEAVKQNKSVNIDVRAYRGEWVAGVGGVQTCKSNSFLDVVVSIEEALAIRSKSNSYQALVAAAKELDISVQTFGVHGGWYYITLGIADGATKPFQHQTEEGVLAVAMAFIDGARDRIKEAESYLKQWCAVAEVKFVLDRQEDGSYTATLQDKTFTGSWVTVLEDAANSLGLRLSVGQR